MNLLSDLSSVIVLVVDDVSICRSQEFAGLIIKRCSKRKVYVYMFVGVNVHK
jgi:hypothetical protein